MSVIANNIVAGAAGQGGSAFQIDRSVRLNSADSAYFSRTPSSAGNRKTWTLSFWVKFCGSSGHLISAGNDAFQIEMRSDGQYLIQNSGCFTNTFSTAVFRDYSAWQHFVIEHDATNTYCKIYVNGSLQNTITASNADGAFNNNTAHNFNGRSTSLDSFTDFYLAEVHFIDGQALDPTDFGEYDDNNVWQPKAYSGTYGTNGFRLSFSDNSSNAALGNDSSGNNNDWTVNNLSVASGAGNDSLVDSPINGTQTDTGAGGEVVGNYCTWNPNASNPSMTLSNGNLDSKYTVGAWVAALGSIGVNSGKWYWEMTIQDNSTGHMFGVAYDQPNLAAHNTTVYGYYNANGQSFALGAQGVSYGSSSTTGDIIGVALDLSGGGTNGTLTFYKNNTSMGTAFSNIDCSKTYFPWVLQNGNTAGSTANFGQRPFAYTAPSGYKALCTTNLPTPTIETGSDYFDTLLWSGTGGNRSLTGLGFSPDFIWFKQRNQAYYVGHNLYDVVRGAGSLKQLDSSNTTEEGGGNTDDYGYLSSFDSAGFSVTSGSTGDHYVNRSGVTYVGWAWDAGDSNTSITAGGLNSSVYNQSQTWSGMMSASGGVVNATYAFNGDTSTRSYTNGTTTAARSLTIDFTGQGLSGNVRIFTYVGRASGGPTISLNSGTAVVANDYQVGSELYNWVDLGDDGAVTTIEITINNVSDSSYVGAVEVDGKLLVDSGVSVTNVPSIASTVRANPSAGFSIVTYTGNNTAGTTVGHGLNAKPSMVIIKSRSIADNWLVAHEGAGTTNDTLGGFPESYTLFLESTAGRSNFTNAAAALGNSSVFAIADGSEVNQNTATYVAYCFAPVEGYSSFGSYVGNGSSDGVFVYTGFRPRWVMIKRTDTTNYWIIQDSARNTFNVVDLKLAANSSVQENNVATIGDTSQNTLDYLSNGFKCRTGNAGTNVSNGTYIYAAFAEHPFALNGGLAR